jgi:hypothetical protein
MGNPYSEQAIASIGIFTKVSFSFWGTKTLVLIINAQQN